MSHEADPDLSLLLGHHGEEGETLLRIGRVDAAGLVSVRRWSGSDWSAVARAERESAPALLAKLERQAAAGRSMNLSLYALRLWLRGEGSGGR